MSSPVELKQRLRAFTLRIIRLIEALPSGMAAQVLGRQLLRSGTSIGANYRAACRARSKAEFISKLGICEEEADETLYWLDIIVAAKLIPAGRVKLLAQEAEEILKIIVSSIKTARRQS
jgi:four helix bundle protein